MSVKRVLSLESDLDRTDKLPILELARFDADIDEDAAHLDRSSVDLPAIAESMRSVEVRIERQNAEYEALTRSYEQAREAETAATARANVLEADLAAVRTALESERNR